MLAEEILLNNTYTIERFLGKGISGEVYRARHKYLGRQAMKVFWKVFDKKEMLKSEAEKHIIELLKEAITLSKVNHPNIVRVFEANIFEEEAGYRAYHTMEYIPCGSLAEYLMNKGHLSVAEAVSIASQICAAVAVAHEYEPPIVHRDLWPANILISYEKSGMRAVVSDWGHANFVNPYTLTTPAAGYCSFKSPDYVDSPASDTFSIGMILYSMLTGRNPFPKGARFDPSIKKEDLYPSKLNPRVDKMLDAIVSKAIAFKISDRYKNAAEMHKDIADYKKKIADSPVSKGMHEVNKDKEPENKSLARDYLRKAIENSKQPSHLREASDYLEKALMLDDSLRWGYADLLELWRKGVIE
jgi:serine/threonine-protein kinase